MIQIESIHHTLDSGMQDSSLHFSKTVQVQQSLKHSPHITPGAESRFNTQGHQIKYPHNPNTWNSSAETTPWMLQTVGCRTLYLSSIYIIKGCREQFRCSAAEEHRVSLLYPHPEAQLAYIHHRVTCTVFGMRNNYVFKIQQTLTFTSTGTSDSISTTISSTGISHEGQLERVQQLACGRAILIKIVIRAHLEIGKFCGKQQQQDWVKRMPSFTAVHFHSAEDDRH